MSDKRLKRNVFVGMSTLSIAMLAFGVDAGNNSAAGTASTGTASTGTASLSVGSSSASAAGSAGSSSSSSSEQTYTGEAVDTQYGPVQVQITVSDGKITAATAVEHPNTDGHDAMINNRAVPVLQDETVQAQGANIDSVSGATFTSQGYIASLQSALDQANL